MKTYRSLYFTSDTPCVTALGCFDGVHVGHLTLINEAKDVAKRLGLSSAIWSFEEPPKNYFSTEKIPLITTREEKRLQMMRLGVDIFVSVPFDNRVASLSAEDFFEKILIKRMKTQHVVCGYNYRFGKNGMGNVEILRNLCKSHGIGISVISEIKIGKATVSSSEIRKMLNNGNLYEANAMLGRPYSLRAKVTDGQHLGRKLGFPTVNQIFVHNKLLPKNGVYISRIRFGKKQRYGITNVGTRPSATEHTLCVETHIFDFCGDLYGQTVTVELLEFLRPEKKFSTLEELKQQVDSDIEKAKNIISKY